MNSSSGFRRTMGPWKARKAKELMMATLAAWVRVPWKESKVNLKEQVWYSGRRWFLVSLIWSWRAERVVEEAQCS
jgi:hypothetical protein